jgi:hypothetical protein
MKKLAITSALLSALATGTAHAYQAEVGGTYAYTDIDNGDSANTFAVDGTIISIQSKHVMHHLKLHFLNRASNIVPPKMQIGVMLKIRLLMSVLSTISR